MRTNFYDAELRRALLAVEAYDHIRDLGDPALLLARLAKAFPVRGSRIDWSRVQGSIERVQDDPTQQAREFIAFVDELTREKGLGGEVVYAGDSATDFALSGPLERIRDVLPKLLAIPQHHYVIGPQFAWCICLTMEGDMAFGFQPIRPA